MPYANQTQGPRLLGSTFRFLFIPPISALTNVSPLQVDKHSKDVVDAFLNSLKEYFLCVIHHYVACSSVLASRLCVLQRGIQTPSLL